MSTERSLDLKLNTTKHVATKRKRSLSLDNVEGSNLTLQSEGSKILVGKRCRRTKSFSRSPDTKKQKSFEAITPMNTHNAPDSVLRTQEHQNMFEEDTMNTLGEKLKEVCELGAL